jgi:hypothetical protein
MQPTLYFLIGRQKCRIGWIWGGEVAMFMHRSFGSIFQMIMAKCNRRCIDEKKELWTKKVCPLRPFSTAYIGRGHFERRSHNMAATSVNAIRWPQEAYTLARQARSLNFLKIEPLIKTLQKISGRSRRGCVLLIHQCVQEKTPRRSWTEEEIDQVRELLVANSVQEVARKIGRSPSSVKHLCSRIGIRSRELRCDLFSIAGLASATHVRKAEILVSIEQGWLEAMRDDEARATAYKISPEAVQRCLREHL